MVGAGDPTHTHTYLSVPFSARTARTFTKASSIDYVWGASPGHINAWRQSSNPDVVLSAYIPFSSTIIFPSTSHWIFFYTLLLGGISRPLGASITAHEAVPSILTSLF